jgi:hypothetical protein
MLTQIRRKNVTIETGTLLSCCSSICSGIPLSLDKLNVLSWYLRQAILKNELVILGYHSSWMSQQIS